MLLLTTDPSPESVLPGLALLPHGVRVATPGVAAVLDAPSCDAVLVDARAGLRAARGLCRLLAATAGEVPVLAVLSEGGLVAVSAEWAVDDILLPGAGPAEIDARLRLRTTRAGAHGASGAGMLVLGELVIDPAEYTARLRGRSLELTRKEFELLHHLAKHPDRVFTRAQLLAEVWGHELAGGTHTVDVHVRRLRAKLGPEQQRLIGTVRNVGYKCLRPQYRVPVGSMLINHFSNFESGVGGGVGSTAAARKEPSHAGAGARPSRPNQHIADQLLK